MKDNRLIADFMGFHRTEKGYIMGGFGDGTFGLAEELHFHTSWDWLMPVIDKCYQEHMSKHIAEAVMTCNINEAYNAVVEFIKEYNDEQQ
jgi:hypothetical protein